MISWPSVTSGRGETMAFLLQGLSAIPICIGKNTTSRSNPTIVLIRCDYQPRMSRWRCSNSIGESFNIHADSTAVSKGRHISEPGSNKDEFWRRDLILYGLLGTTSFLFTAMSGAALDSAEMDENVDLSDFAIQVDEINAYSFNYPLKLPRRQVKLNWIESRKPERYSSAAPLSADGRQRIVSERLDIKDNLVISVSIGPPNYLFLTSKDKSKWEANDVAKSILADKSTARLTTGQRVAESSVIGAHCHNVAGEPYWYYEYLAQKSPTALNDQQLIYRHSIAVTAEREGYLYSLNVSALSKNWNVMQPMLRKTISSFHLLPPTQNYVPPYKDPWRFW